MMFDDDCFALKTLVAFKAFNLVDCDCSSNCVDFDGSVTQTQVNFQASVRGPPQPAAKRQHVGHLCLFAGLRCIC